MAQQVLQIRRGNKASCHICYHSIPYGSQRLVINLSSNHYPHHYHLDCIIKDSADVITHLAAFITYKRGSPHA